MSPDSTHPHRSKQLLLALPIPLLLVAADFYVRGAALAKLSSDFKAYYVSSVVFIVFAWYAAIGFSKWLLERSRLWGFGFVVLMATAYTLTVLGAFAFFEHFNVMPNVFVFDYIFDEPRDCLIYLKAALEPRYLAITAAAVFGLTAFIAQASRHPAVATTRRDLLVNSTLLVALGFFFHNNVRLGPNAFTPEVHALFSLSKAAENAVFGGENVQVVGSGARQEVDKTLGPLPFNVLLVLNESIRAKSQSIYGYYRDTTPNLRQLFASRPEAMIRFDHAYANATRTMLAFPSYFTGIVPSQSGALLHRVPLAYDFARAFDNPQTFLISTQSMHWGNFDRFLDVNKLDFAWYKEISVHNDENADRFESLDDKYLPEAFAAFVTKRDITKKFFGVVQLTNTHAPYFFDKASDIWHDSRLTNAYDNSLHYQDRQMGRVLATLQERGLLANTLIISTSDHGEAFGEHGYYGHLNTFYDEEARVPFWIHLPDQLANDTRLVRQLQINARDYVSNADVIPTLLSLLAGEKFALLKPLLANLTGAALDRPLPQGRGIYMQNYNDVDEKTMFIGLGLVTEHYKYLLKFNQALGEEELYDLQLDPKEQHNIWATAPAALKARVYQLIQQHKNSKDLFTKAFPVKARHS